jgi:SagB-type dehydrogenase family enzyme
MKKRKLVPLLTILSLLTACLTMTESLATDKNTAIKLPRPNMEGSLSIEEGLQRRRSVRAYTKKPLTLTELSQLLWAAQGITGPYGMRTAPSAGALYPVELYILSGNVTGLPAGVYRYLPRGHELLNVAIGDRRQKLAEAALGQACIREGSAVIVIAAVYERTTGKYGQRGIRYVHMEVGNISQNIYLEAESLSLGTVFVGAFDDERVKSVLEMRPGEKALGLMPVGKAR